MKTAKINVENCEENHLVQHDMNGKKSNMSQFGEQFSNTVVEELKTNQENYCNNFEQKHSRDTSIIYDGRKIPDLLQSSIS